MPAVLSDIVPAALPPRSLQRLLQIGQASLPVLEAERIGVPHTGRTKFAGVGLNHAKQAA